MALTEFRHCQIQYAGVLADGEYRRVIVPVNEDDNVSVSARLVSGTWGTAVLRLRRSNLSAPGTWNEYSPAVDVTNNGTTTLWATEAGFVCVEVTTGEGASGRIDVSIYTSATGR